MLIFYPSIRTNLTNRAMAKIDLEQLERLHEQVRMRSTNTGAKFKIAEMLYRRGFVGHALGLAEALSPDMPASLYPDENRLLRQWRELNQGRVNDRPIACPRCGTYNLPGGISCEQCHADYLLLTAKGSWLGGYWGLKVIGAWMVAMVALIGIPTLASLPVRREVIIIGVLGLMGIGIYALLSTFLKGGGSD
jgi:hypothetical protein